MENRSGDKPKVGLFVTCLVDLIRPSVGFSAISLLEQAGCQVEVPSGQTCCGQPGYNSGDRDNARAVAEQVIPLFEPYDYVVIPSGSCAEMIAHQYPQLFPEGSAWQMRALALGEKCFELTSFLVDVMKYAPSEPLGTPSNKTYTYHDSCSGLRKMKVKQQPRQLLKSLQGIDLVEMAQTEVCCGFGGTFAVKMPEISERIVSRKVANVEATGADVVLGGDMGCLLNIAGKLTRDGKNIEVRHVAEVLAGKADIPGIGQGEQP